MIWDRYLSNTTGFEIKVEKGVRFTPRFYCDDTTGTVYITKNPVAVLILDPIVQFINTNIAWDVSNSVSATGTIDTYDLTFGGGGASDLTGQSFAGAKTGNVQYTSTGTFTVTLTVTDTGGLVSQPAKQVVNIVDIQSINKVYIATDDTGIFTYLPGGTPAALSEFWSTASSSRSPCSRITRSRSRAFSSSSGRTRVHHAVIMRLEMPPG